MRRFLKIRAALNIGIWDFSFLGFNLNSSFICTSILNNKLAFKTMKKNRFISLLTQVVMNAFPERGFFVMPVLVSPCTRPFPYWVRR